MKNNYTPKILLAVLYIYSIGLYATPPEPPLGERWVRNDLYSDEFNANSLNTLKWRNTFNGWKGRKPAFFNPNTVSVNGGNMIIRNQPGVPSNAPDGYTMSGGAVQSKNETAHFGYYECNFKASRVNMPTTFWLSYSGQAELRTADGNDTYSQELDICESIGGAGNFSSDFRKKMKFNTHYRIRKDPWPTPETFYSRGNNQVEIRDGDLQGGDASLVGGTESWQDYHTYACHWRSAQDATFFVDNKFIGVVKFRTDIVPDPFKDPMRINMVTETYTWATPFPTDEQLNNDQINASYYNWIRTYAKIPVDQVSTLDDEEEIIFTESTQFKDFQANRNPNSSYSFPILYKANKDRDVHIIIRNSTGNIIKNQKYLALAGYGHKAYIVALDSPLVLGSYTVEVQITNVNNTNIINSEIKNLNIQDGDISNPTVSIDFVNPVSKFEVGSPLTFQADYSTNEPLELIFVLNSADGTWLGNKKQVVPSGSGTITGTIETTTTPTIANNYKVAALLRPIDGDWADNLIIKETFVDIVEVFVCPTSNVYNECFEDGLYSWEGWGNATKEVISNQANNGTYALKIKGLGASNFTIENLTPNTQYELSAFTKVVGNQGVNFGVKEFNGTTDQAISVTSQVYEKKTHTFTTGPNNTSAQIYWYSANTNGEGYIDDISLQQLTVTSINSSNTQNQFYAYPNPTNNLLYLSKVLNWELTTIQGSIIKSGFGKQINTTSLPTGTFLLQTRHKTIRIVKQ